MEAARRAGGREGGSMSDTAILALVLLAMVVGLLVGHVFGERRGRDLQRVADITESWARMQPRDNLGRYRRAEK